MKIHRGFVVLCWVLAWCSTCVGPAGAAPPAAPLAVPPVVRYVALPVDGGVDTGACDVTAAPCATIQYAVNQSGAGDEIRVGLGTYTDTHTLTAVPGYPTTTAVTQTAVITKNLTLRGGYDPVAWSHAPADTSTISPADRSGRGLVVLNAGPWIESVVISACSAIGQGGVPGASGVDAGGGLYVRGGSPTISGTTAITNTAGPDGRGAGAYALDSNTTFINSAFLDNGGGGADYGAGAAYGGGLYVERGTLDLQNGQWAGNGARQAGGGLYVAGSSARMENVTLVENVAGRCAGLYATGGAMDVLTATIRINRTAAGPGGGGCAESGAFQLRDSLLDNNQASTHGGGFAATGGQATFAANQFVGNKAGQSDSGLGAGNGGGLALFGSPTSAYTLTANVFGGNLAFGLVGGGGNGQGGGLYALMAAATRLISNTFEANTALAAGGGAFFDQSDRVSAVRNAFRANMTLGEGAALAFSLSANATLTNTLIADNTAMLGYPGLSVVDSTARLWHTTLANNAPNGSAVHVSGRSPSRLTIPPATVALTNTIFATNFGGVVVDSAGVVTLDHTLWDSNFTMTATTGSGRIFSTADYSGTALFLAPGADYRLQPVSAAIDRGVNAGVTQDLAGKPRPVGPAPDLGAYEFQGAIALNKHVELNPAVAAQLITYTITLTNTGAAELMGFVTDLPQPPLVPAGGPLSWMLPSLPPGEVWTQAVTLTTAPGFSGTVTNTVMAMTLITDTGMVFPGPTAAYTVTSQVLAPGAPEVSKSIYPTTPAAGGLVKYTVMITNTGVVPLHMAMMDTTPITVPMTWTAVIAQNGVWSTTYALRIPREYTGTLPNVFEATSAEGPGGTAAITATVLHLDLIQYLPLLPKNWSSTP